MKTGFAKKCITPPMGYPIVGYFEERFASAVIDDLYVRAAAFNDGKTKAVVIAADLCYIGKDLCDLLRNTVAEACSMDPDAVFICCNHTHTGPLVSPEPAYERLPDPAYLETLQLAFRDAAVESMADLKESRFFVAQTEAEGISFLRRFRMKDGSVKKPIAGDPDIVCSMGKANPIVKILKILRQGGDDLVIVNFGTHSDTVKTSQISADYSGYLCAALEGALPDTNAMFLLGPEGDAIHRDLTRADGGVYSFRKEGTSLKDAAPHARYMGRVLAGKVLTVYDRADEIPADAIRFGCIEVEVPSNQENDRLEEAERIGTLYRAGKLEGSEHAKTCAAAEALRILELKDGPESFRLKVFAIRFGDFVLAGLPGEPFTALRSAIETRSPFENTMVCCLVNDAAGYFPYSDAYQEGSYEVIASYYGPETANILVDGMIELLHSLQ